MSGEPPAGRVAFLFTDLEGSTRLWEHRPDDMPAVYVRHDAILRAAASARGGVVYKVIGDAFQIAFHRAEDALGAALDAQRALLAEPWPISPAPRVRMALHVCDVDPQPDGDYRTPGLNRLGRLLSAADGGQILLSETAAGDLAERLPSRATLRDLGMHRFRDLSPQRVFQAFAPGLPAGVATLRALSPHRHNLPVPVTAFIGRDGDVRRAQKALTAPRTRLLTLLGPGGIGKTRLSIEVATRLADRYPGGVWFVPLAAVVDPDRALPAIAAALDVREAVDQSLHDAVTAFLAGPPALLVLDNVEQVLAAAPRIAALIADCPDLTVLATSRIPLGIAGERELPVPPLIVAIPDSDPRRAAPDAPATPSDAVRLFEDRARLVRPDFAITPRNAATVAAICGHLDGLPLAIELAAARSRLLPPDQLLARLQTRLDFLTGGPRDLPARQRTLRAAIDWSHDLLAEEERTLFRRLSVFVGGATLEAIAAVCGIDAGDVAAPDPFATVESLARQSLLVLDESEVLPRVRMLETIREYAAERLSEAGETAALARRHAAYFRDLAQWAEPRLSGADQADWLDAIAAEHDNLRAALDTLDRNGDVADLVAMAGALWWFWWVRGHLTEGRDRLRRALALGEDLPLDPALLARALDGAGALAEAQGDIDQAVACHQRAHELWTRAGDQAGQARSLVNLGIIELHDRGNPERARTLYEDALAAYRVAGDQEGVAAALKNLGDAALTADDVERAAALYEESLAIARSLHDTRGVAAILTSLGALAFFRGDHQRAIALYEESLPLWRALDDVPGTALALGNLGEALYHAGEVARAKSLYTESLALARDLGDRQGIAFAQSHLAQIARREGDRDRALSLFTESAGICQDVSDSPRLAESLEGIAGVLADTGAAEDAARLLGAATRLRKETGSPLPDVHAASFERDLDATRKALSADAFAASYAAGLAVSPETVVTALLTPLTGHACGVVAGSLPPRARAI